VQRRAASQKPTGRVGALRTVYQWVRKQRVDSSVALYSIYSELDAFGGVEEEAVRVGRRIALSVHVKMASVSCEHLF
jgi:hypothetical protein